MQSNCVLCLGSFASPTVDLAFHVQWDICQVQGQKPFCGKFAWLADHASLANRAGAPVVVAKARCHCCFSMGQLVTRCHRLSWS